MTKTTPEPEPAPGSGRVWWYLGLGFLTAWCLYLMLFGPRVQVNPPRLVDTGLAQPAEYRWTLRDLNDAPVEFATYRGKAVFLNIWATECPPCVAELPSIARLAADPRLAEVAFVCVSTDDSAAPVRKFLRGKNWKPTILRATDLPEVFSTDGIPATFLIAPDGRIAAFELGAARWDDTSVVDFLERLAKP